MDNSVDAKIVKNWISDEDEIAFIDVREISQHTEGHPFFSVSIPFSVFEMNIEQFLPNKKVRVVLFDNNNGISELAYKHAKALGYIKIFILKGGVKGWLEANFKLFDGINVPSKSFGELVEHKFHTPSITAAELSKKQKEKKNIIILDGRPFEEYNKMSIPGSICCPNAEIPYKISSIVKNSKTDIIVNCAGRTRSIIGAQTLINFGIKNKVYALENGTQGWFLSNLNLENNKTNYLKIEPKKNEIEKLKNKITNLLNKNHIQVINLSKVQDLIEDETRSTYIFNVKTNLSSNISIHGIRNVPGGQLVQATDNYVGVLKSRIILFDEGDLVRAGTTALWLKKMNFECYVFKGIETEIKNLNIKYYTKFKVTSLNYISLNDLKKPNKCVIFDIRKSIDYCKTRLKNSIWLNRSNLKQNLPNFMKNIVIVFDNISIVSLIVSDLKEIYPEIQVEVYQWNDEEVFKFPEYLEQNLIKLDKKFIDFNFHTYMRHMGNKIHAKQYLKWETDLLDKMDKQEINFFKIGNVNVEN